MTNPDEMRYMTRFMRDFGGPDLYVAIPIGADDVHLKCVYILLCWLHGSQRCRQRWCGTPQRCHAVCEAGDEVRGESNQ